MKKVFLNMSLLLSVGTAAASDVSYRSVSEIPTFKSELVLENKNNNVQTFSGDAEIDVLVVFDQDSANWVHSKYSRNTLEDSIDFLIDKRVKTETNKPFNRISLSSGGVVRINFLTPIVMEHWNFSSLTHKELHSLLENWTYSEEINIIRKRYGADIVAFYKTKVERDTAGGRAAYLRLETDNERYKRVTYYSIDVESAEKEGKYYDNAHEIGHLLGGAHDLITSSRNPTTYKYKREAPLPYRYAFGAAYDLSNYEGYDRPFGRSVMSYDECKRDQEHFNDGYFARTGYFGELPVAEFSRSNCNRVSYFTDGGEIMGRFGEITIDGSKRNVSANNVAAIKDSAHIVASYY